MEIPVQSDLSSLILVISAVQESIASSAVFSMLAIFLGAYTLVVLADVTLLFLLRDVRGDLKKTLYGNTRPMVSPSKFTKRWDAVTARIKSGNPSQYKVAVLEADVIAEEMLGGIGYGGSNMKERLEAVRPGQIVSLDRLRSAHETRNRIIRDPSFALSREEAESVLSEYKSFFEELELF